MRRTRRGRWRRRRPGSVSSGLLCQRFDCYSRTNCCFAAVCVDQLGVFLAQEIASLSRGLWVDVRLINHSSDCDRALTSCYIKRSGSLQFVGGLTAIFFFSFSFLLGELCSFFKRSPDQFRSSSTDPTVLVNICFRFPILVFFFGAFSEAPKSRCEIFNYPPVDIYASADSSVSFQRRASVTL